MPKEPASAAPPANASLSEYDRKRNFARTPEPGPDAKALSSSSPRFMVHKHHARRLHYDLRLEIDGALGSWAVPRGPCYDPEVKRLAVQTEDHPLAYGDFEGRIPDGLYGAGESLVWDRGHFDTIPPGQVAAMRRKGHVHFSLSGEKLRGEWHLLRTTSPDGRRVGQSDPKGSGPKSQWLLVKVKDAFADRSLDIVVARPESVLTGQIETRGPQPAFRGGGEGTTKPSMPVLLASGVLGSEPSAAVIAKKPTRIPTPLFAVVPLANLQIDLSRPQELLELPGHLFGEAGENCATVARATPSASTISSASESASAASTLPAELLFLLERNDGARAKELGPVAEVAHVLHDFFAALKLDALACTAGPRALLVRVSVASAPGLTASALSAFAEKIAATLSSQVGLLAEKKVELRVIPAPDPAGASRLDASNIAPGKITSKKPDPARGAASNIDSSSLSSSYFAPAPFAKLPGHPRLISAPLSWSEVTAALSPAQFTAGWLKEHRAEAEARLQSHRAAAAPLPRAR